jgi:hypothetical protein
VKYISGGCTINNTILINVLASTNPGCTGGGGGGNVDCTKFTQTVVGEVRPSCSTKDDGQISFNVIGVIPKPSYVLTLYDSARVPIFTKAVTVAPSTTYIFGGLSPSSNYFYRVDDGTSSCTLPYSLPVQSTVTASADPLSFVDVTCFGKPTGQAILSIAGGNSPYEYSIDGGASFTGGFW